MKPTEELRVVFESSLGSPGANDRLPDGRYKFEYVEAEWQQHVARVGRRDEILAMAREAGLQRTNPGEAIEVVRFAALVAAKEREACADLCDRFAARTTEAQQGPSDALSNVMLRQVAVLGFGEAAYAIRARGQKEGV